MHDEILRYMGHSGAPTAQLESLISSCLEKLGAVSKPRHVMRQFQCTVSEDSVTIDVLKIKSKGLAAHLCACTQVYLFAATLGADVDRLITQRSMRDSAEAFCLQACAAVQIEDYCDNIVEELSHSIEKDGLYLRPRFSPGYSDFNLAFQTDLLNMLQAHKFTGISETSTHMLTPLKSVSAVIGVNTDASRTRAKCQNCDKADCAFKQKEIST